MKCNSIAPFLAGFVVLGIVLDRTAAALGSFRGEAGIAIDESRFMGPAIAWMALSAIAPWLFFLMRARTP